MRISGGTFHTLDYFIGCHGYHVISHNPNGLHFKAIILKFGGPN